MPTGCTDPYGNQCVPNPIQPISNKCFASISKGSQALHVAAIDVEGGLSIWGWNEFGQAQIYNNPLTGQSMMESSLSLAVGWDFTASVTLSNTVQGWGASEMGQYLGTLYANDYPNGTGTPYPRDVYGDDYAPRTAMWGSAQREGAQPLTGITKIACGKQHMAALNELTGQVYTWGGTYAMDWDASWIPPEADVARNGGIKITDISCGAGHTLALRSDGVAIGWGESTYGQIFCSGVGQGTTGSCILFNGQAQPCNGDGTQSRPAVSCAINEEVIIANQLYQYTLYNIKAVAAGSDHSAFLTKEGTVFCIGRNNHGQTDTISNGEEIVKISCGAYHTIALTITGKVLSWGDNKWGQCSNSWLGRSIDLHTDEQGNNRGNVIDISGGAYFTTVLYENGSIIVIGSVPETDPGYADSEDQQEWNVLEGRGKVSVYLPRGCPFCTNLVTSLAQIDFNKNSLLTGIENIVDTFENVEYGSPWNSNIGAETTLYSGYYHFISNVKVTSSALSFGKSFLTIGGNNTF